MVGFERVLFLRFLTTECRFYAQLPQLPIETLTLRVFIFYFLFYPKSLKTCHESMFLADSFLT